MKKLIGGIYSITCVTNNKSYIGSSYDIYNRWSDHKRILRKNQHHSIKLQRSWNKYGEENFLFSIVEEVLDSDELENVEQIWLDTGDFYKKGLNCSPYDREKDRWEHNHKTQNKNCIVKWPDGKEEEIIGLTKFCRKNGLNQGAMNQISLHKLNHYKNFHCRMADESMEDWKRHREKIVNSRPPKKMPSPKRQSGTWTIIHPDGTPEEVLSLTSFCKKNNLSQGNMTEVANGKRKQHKGFRCSYRP
jgi:group I intron endonuclease